MNLYQLRVRATALLLFCFAFNAGANTFTVTNSNDAGAGSLRKAVNSAATGDSIVFDVSTNGQPVVLTTGAITIDAGITITGNGATNTIIDGNQNSNIFDIAFTDDTANVYIQYLKIQNGYNSAGMGGGGIDDYGQQEDNGYIVNLSYVEIANCVSVTSVYTPAGALNIRSGTIDNCYIHNNRQLGQSGGAGGVRGLWKPITISNSTIAYCTGNSVGGVMLGPVNTITNSTVYADTGYSVTGATGGVTLGQSNIINCTVTGNVGTLTGGVERQVIAHDNVVNNIIYGNTGGSAADFYIDDYANPTPDISTYSQNITGQCAVPNQNVYACPTWYSTANPLLGTFGMHGGPWPTIPILTGSQAIGHSDGLYTPATDERGYVRHNPGDIGAYEANSYAPCTAGVIDTLTSADTICAGFHGYISVTGNLYASTKWQLYDVSCSQAISPIDSTTNIFTVSPVTTTTYYVNAYACANTGMCDSITINVRNCTTINGINNIDPNQNISLYPNPNNGNFTINLNSSQPHTIIITNAIGAQIASYANVAFEKQVDITTLPTGVYFVTALTGDGLKEELRFEVVR